MLIPGPNGPGDAIDTYLQPLIEELKELWEVGIETYDASARKNFKLHASLLWTINDFPAYGNLSGWSTKGKLACPCCNKNTSSTRLTNGKKQCYMGHRRYLPHNHKWRNDKKSFDGTEERSPSPHMRSGIEILNQVQDLEGQQLSKDPKKRKKISHENRNDNWNKKRKTKDTIKTRLDLQEMNIRPELHPIQKGEKIEVPTACYTLSPEEKHKACLEGCIAEGYIANECMTLCSRYLHRIDTKFNRPERNYDGALKQSNGGLSLFCQPGRTLGAKTPFELEADELEQAHIYILKNCDEVLPYLEEFAQTHENAHHLSDVEWNRQFIEWFKDRVAQLHKGDASLIMEDLLSLSRGPTRYSTHSNGYIVNGYRFHVEDYDKKLRTQNCGVVVLGENDKDSENLDYYGVLTDVIELQFVMDRRKDEYDFVSVNPDRFLKTNKPFVLADQAFQVFYANDNSNKGWQVVRKTQPRDSYEIVEQMHDDIVELGSPSQKKHKRTNEVKFKMKPLKTENEVDSSMKSTIRYTFVAPGAIGKGRGRGLKSLAERRNFPTKWKGRGQGLTNSTLFTSQGMTTIPKNSIDLEKENKQTNPSTHASTNIGKGRGQGLTNSTLFTSQGMATKPKNSIDLEKENKQTNPSAHASTNLGSIGKGRGQGLKISTFSTSQGMGMKHNNYMTSDSEVGCINKSALYANQHIKTPSKSTRANSTMSSSQEM
ncbi:hypothetical protein KY289_032077 [Solanum tuberosum]|nr:hypothetical protein KY289_032077 [Solanum tuberosum]